MARLLAAVLACWALGAGAGANGAEVPWAVSFGQENWNLGSSVASVPDGSAIVAGQFSNSLTLAGTTMQGSGLIAFMGRVSEEGVFQWVLQTVSSSPGAATIAAVDALADGSSVVVGQYTGTLSFGGLSVASAGGNDVFVAKVSASGTVAWLRTAGGAGHESAAAISAFPDGGFVAAGAVGADADFGAVAIESGVQNDGFVARLTAEGAFTWASRIKGVLSTDHSVVAVAALGDGTAVATGKAYRATFGTHQWGTPTNDAFIAKLSVNGEWLWLQRVGGSGDAVAESVAPLGGDSMLVAGDFTYSALLGLQQLTSSGMRDVFVAKISTDTGAFQWATKGGGANWDAYARVAALPDGSGLLTAGYGDSPIFGSTTLPSGGAGFETLLVRVTPSGTFESAERLGATGSDTSDIRPSAIATFGDGGAVVAGNYDGPVLFGSQALSFTPAHLLNSKGFIGRIAGRASSDPGSNPPPPDPDAGDPTSAPPSVPHTVSPLTDAPAFDPERATAVVFIGGRTSRSVATGPFSSAMAAGSPCNRGIWADLWEATGTPWADPQRATFITAPVLETSSNMEEMVRASRLCLGAPTGTPPIDATMVIESNGLGFASNTDRFASFLRWIRKAGYRRVLLVGHSMGGVIAHRVSRLARKQRSPYPGLPEIVGVVTLNAPHLGSFLAVGGFRIIRTSACEALGNFIPKASLACYAGAGSAALSLKPIRLQTDARRLAQLPSASMLLIASHLRRRECGQVLQISRGVASDLGALIPARHDCVVGLESQLGRARAADRPGSALGIPSSSVSVLNVPGVDHGSTYRHPTAMRAVIDWIARRS